jgi:hypothetical protein
MPPKWFQIHITLQGPMLIITVIFTVGLHLEQTVSPYLV